MKNIDAAFDYCYTELYKNAEPSADFKTLVENATTNERGEKSIDFMAYEISDKKMDEIIADTIRRFKIGKYYQSGFRTGIYLGCSPRSKKTE